MDVREQVLSARLEQLPSFQEVSRDCRRALAGLAEARNFATGSSVMAEGEPAPGLYIILQGRVKMTRSNPAGGQAVLALFGPGDIFGAVSALNGRLADASMVTLERSECLEVRRPQLLGLMRERPELMGELLPLLSLQLVECRNCLVEAISSRVEVRFAHLFLKLGEKIGRSEEGGTFVPVSLSRQDLADMAGTSLESSIRVMSRWGKQGWVETGSEGFLVRDRRALERIARA